MGAGRDRASIRGIRAAGAGASLVQPFRAIGVCGRRERLRSLLRPERRIIFLVLAVLACDVLPNAVGMAGERFVVVGGGVSGVTCCQTLTSAIQEARAAAAPSPVGESCITLVAAAGLLKGAANVVRLSRHVESFDVVQQPFDAVAGPHTEVIEGEAVAVDTESKELVLRDGRKVPFDKLCICTGARPKLISQHERVMVLRDTSSVQQFRSKLRSCRRVLITGNGGIAMELVHEITNCQVVWVVREGHIGNAFFDQDAAQFLAPVLAARLAPPPADPMGPIAVPGHTASALRNESMRGKETDLAASEPEDQSVTETVGGVIGRSGEGVRGRNEGGGLGVGNDAMGRGRGDGELLGSSLGPQWLHAALAFEYQPSQPRSKEGFGLLRGAGASATGAHGEREEKGERVATSSPIFFEKLSEVVKVDDSCGGVWPLAVTLADGRMYGVDYVVSAIGVEHSDPIAGNLVCKGGAIQVDEFMRASAAGVYAAGDACFVLLSEEVEREWFQMRLWSQARSQGIWAAYCMLGQQDYVASPLELFAHATHFFGYKVVLLGRFNGQGLDKKSAAYQELVRSSPGHHYVKAVLFHGRLTGAVLLGDTDLEETFENLILNRFDLRFLGNRLLDPDLDLEDYFD